MFIGRDSESARLGGLLRDARAGRSGALLVHGEAGSGKTALFAETVDAAHGLQVLRARGVETESHLAFAGLAELLAPVLELRPQLPAVQARALGGALALEDAGAVAPFAVAAAVLSLLAAAAEREPVLVVVDDVQWVDEASRSALLFAARRLEAEGVVLLLGMRDGEGLEAEELGLETIALSGLDREEALALLASGGHDLAPAVAERLVAATQGMPLALLEIPPLLSAEQRAGQAALEEPLPLGRGLDRAFGRRIAGLSAEARRALLLAACAEDGSAATVLAALAEGGSVNGALDAAEREGLVRLEGTRLEFRHPLVRSAALREAGAAERREAHLALAATLPAGTTARAWHLAAGASGHDAEVAAELAAAGADARTRGAPAEAARAFGRAAELEPDPDAASRLLLEGAAVALLAGQAARARDLADAGAARAVDPALGADLRAMHARIDLRMGAPMRAASALVQEAERLEGTDPVREALFLLEAAAADMASGALVRMIERASRARDAAAEALPPVAQLAAVLIGEAQLALGRSAEGDAVLAAAEPVLLRYEPGSAPGEVVGMAAHSSLWVERFDRAEGLFDRLVATLRAASAIGELVYPLAARSHLEVRLGRWPAALADASEAVRLGEETGQESLLSHALGALAEAEAGLGHTAAAREHAERAIRLAQAQGAHAIAAYAHCALALLAVGLGELEDAVDHGLAAARATATTDNDEPGIVRYAPDLIEALVRLGRAEEAEEHLADLERQSDRPGHTWTQAVCFRLRGLMAADDLVDDLFARALALHDQTPQPFEAARTRLVHGERLRRAKRRADARRPLRGALQTFERLGAEPWADRARAELRATGGPTGGAAPAVVTDELTAQELQIALQVSSGHTNREVAAALFLSPKTIEYHLGAVYRKLGIRRRTELAGALA